MKKIILILFFILHLLSFNIYANYYYKIKEPTKFQSKYVNFGVKYCTDYSEEDIPTIFIPGILASWYSEDGYKDSKVKRWIPDPITHSYDTLFHTFKKNGYELKDVLYRSEYDVLIHGNSKKSLYLFGYDWKKDNKITATILNDLISQIRKKYVDDNGCDIGKVNIIAHSMGGLVARAMLEDMCVSDEELEKYKNIKQANGKIFNFTSTKCIDQTKINKLITISTPHRGSPQSLPIWEKGDLYTIEALSKSATLLTQFGTISTNSFYSILHGYDSKVPNGIVTIGQLLPDIQNNSNSFNNILRYLFKNKGDKYYINKDNYSKNSFLEELNKKENIDKMWDKIENKYNSYYSILTGNYYKNNIVGYNLKDSTSSSNIIIKGDNIYDLTEEKKGKDIYEYYQNYNKSYDYYINSIIQKQDGTGGDGTVPTDNLKLIPNNVLGGEIKNDKFESIELKCYKNEIPEDIESIKEDFVFHSDIYKNIGAKSTFQACSHSNTPISLSYEIYTSLVGKKIKGKEEEVNIIKRDELLSNIGYVNYTNKIVDFNRIDTDLIGPYTNVEGIKNYQSIDYLFENNYINVVSKDDIKKDKTKDGPIKVSLSFDGTLGNVKSVFDRYDVLSPINLLIEDEQGRRIGIDPESGRIINEIPGAWTSGDTEGSGEPEFFLIPRVGTGVTNHRIKTYGTGDGEYHIVKQEIDLDNFVEDKKEKLVIAGNARENFGEDYLVVVDEKESSFENLSDKIPTTLEINNKDILTRKDSYKIRYTIRGKNDNVDKIKYVLNLDGKKFSEKEENINGIINVDTSKIGKYELEIFLLDFDGNILENEESKVNIKINRIEKFSNKSSGSIEDKSFLTKELLENIENKSFLKTNYSSGFLDFEIYKNLKNKLFSDIGLGLNHSFYSQFYFDKDSKKIEVILANGKSNIFEYKNLEYEKIVDNSLDITESKYNIEIFDSEEKKTYYFDKNSFKLTKILSTDKQINIYYNSDGNIDYVTDNETNSYFFTYKDNLLTEISDIFENKIIFEYSDLFGDDILSNIEFNNNENIYFGINNKNEFEIIGENYEINIEKQFDNKLFYNFEDYIILNDSKSQIKYIKGLDGNLYSFLGNNIYLIKNGKRKTVLKNTTEIKNIFITKEGEVYFYDGDFKVLGVDNTVKILSDNIKLNNFNFVIEEGNIYYLDKFNKGYLYFDTKSGNLNKIHSSYYYNLIYIKNGEILFNESQNNNLTNINSNLEFDEKFKVKLNNIQTKINTKFSKKQKKSLKSVLQKNKSKFIENINSDYSKIEIEYLLDRVEELLILK